MSILAGVNGLCGSTMLGLHFRSSETRVGPTSRGWFGEALQMLRADVTNVDYLVHGFCRR